ncbi:target of rapamycin complex 2 subunit bit61 [Acrodontium crateriforme]|uniref:Target of rapamycin complex 2 subunit bit61 n=1 Tax=Acrodontium crateriforme TaxID=150365 RepID=A0AAQ3M0R3_9PEZI|nr:target of rapamycin complex 2 subunit bit61 [Acrodontium crateriforme]
MSNNNNHPPVRPQRPPSPPVFHRSQSASSQARSESSLSTTSNESLAQQMPPPSLSRRSPYIQHTATTRPSTANGPGSASQSMTSLQKNPPRASVDGISRAASPGNLYPQQQQNFTIASRRQFSQGFFEPSLSSQTNASHRGLTASQIAAQAAMHGVSPPLPQGQERKRSHPGLSPINTSIAGVPTIIRRQASDTSSPPLTAGLSYNNGTLGGNRLAATTAANVAFPNGRSPLPSPGPPSPQHIQLSQPPVRSQTPTFPPEKEAKSKSSKMKLFSKTPKTIGLSKDGKTVQTVPSPSKSAINSTLLRGGFANASTTSLVGPDSSASSLYSSANASTSTLVPVTTEKEKEKRHNFLSRQKNKLKDEPSSLPLSSAHSNSQPTNPDKPQPLYSFTPDSPGPTSFAKSMSGFDLRHGGRALREKKKEEKAAAAAARLDLTPTLTNTSMVLGATDTYMGSSDNILGPPSGGNASIFGFPSDSVLAVSAQAFSNIGAQMGIPGIGPDDAWPLLKARLLNLFSGEDLRTPIEDFNTLVNVHIRRCIQRKSPVALIEDVRELLQTGFVSLAQTLRGIPDDRLVPKFVEIWTGVYCSILPFLQAVFLPLDLEFKGRGVIMSVREAQEFWGAMPESLKSDERPSSAGGTTRPPTLGEELDVRRITLISFRDTVILPKHESLMAIFSRLSLDSINASTTWSDTNGGRQHARSDPSGGDRPGTAGSLSPHIASYNSQSSTLLDVASTTSSGGAGGLSLASRSRATSNTSAGSFGTNLPHLNSPGGSHTQGSFSIHTSTPPLSNAPGTPQAVTFTDPAKVTDTVARMLQCLSVLASCQTGDVGQGVVERLTGALKYNWLGRGRTGRNRRGWVGMKNPPRGLGLGVVTGSTGAAGSGRRDERARYGIVGAS